MRRAGTYLGTYLGRYVHDAPEHRQRQVQPKNLHCYAQVHRLTGTCHTGEGERVRRGGERVTYLGQLPGQRRVTAARGWGVVGHPCPGLCSAHTSCTHHALARAGGTWCTSAPASLLSGGNAALIKAFHGGLWRLSGGNAALIKVFHGGLWIRSVLINYSFSKVYS